MSSPLPLFHTLNPINCCICYYASPLLCNFERWCQLAGLTLASVFVMLLRVRPWNYDSLVHLFTLESFLDLQLAKGLVVFLFGSTFFHLVLKRVEQPL